MGFLLKNRLKYPSGRIAYCGKYVFSYLNSKKGRIIVDIIYLFVVICFVERIRESKLVLFAF